MQFIAKLSAFLTFTREEVELMARCAENHYDAFIRSLVPPGPGAIINGMLVHFWAPPSHPGDMLVKDHFTFREIDSLLKAIEDDMTPLAHPLRQRLERACQKINELTVSMNAMLETLGTE